MADEEAQLLNKQAAAPAKASSSWRLVVVALVLGLVAGYVAGAAGVNKTNPLELVKPVKTEPDYTRTDFGYTFDPENEE